MQGSVGRASEVSVRGKKLWSEAENESNQHRHQIIVRWRGVGERRGGWHGGIKKSRETVSAKWVKRSEGFGAVMLKQKKKSEKIQLRYQRSRKQCEATYGIREQMQRQLTTRTLFKQ